MRIFIFTTETMSAVPPFRLSGYVDSNGIFIPDEDYAERALSQMVADGLSDKLAELRERISSTLWAEAYAETSRIFNTSQRSLNLGDFVIFEPPAPRQQPLQPREFLGFEMAPVPRGFPHIVMWHPDPDPGFVAARVPAPVPRKATLNARQHVQQVTKQKSQKCKKNSKKHQSRR